ncbi:MAG: tetrahydrofolate dehydrogenase/cyclohydrolase catalytic domain-containing protein, partial [Candidatus Cloacimonetes bacterium]|nr:tetrahydrofolate dehydrogenase/cyclohydrolase catalytic domain-containing protein [Candidatus Cloacimonadota bacterium]
MQKELKGKVISLAIKKVVKALVQEFDLTPTMRLIQVGEDPASSFYVHSILSAASNLGCKDELISLPKTASEQDLLSAIQAANADSNVH